MAQTLLGAPASGDGDIDKQVDLEISEQLVKDHELDNLNLFIYMMLLILTILTAWFFKHVRNRYIHETGLAVVYGLIIGLIMRETAPPPDKPSLTCDKPFFGPSSTDSYLTPHIYFRRCPNDSSLTNCPRSSATRVYEYAFVGAVSETDVTANRGQTGLAAKATFDSEVFFNIILPAIIFNAGYSMKRRHFFVNIGAILVYAFIGTAISTFAIAGVVYVFCLLPGLAYLNFTFTDAMFFGSIISATDPVSILAIFSELSVDVDLQALVLGEAVLNDAVAIVLSLAVLGYTKASVPHGTDDTTSAQATAIAQAFGNFFVVFLGAVGIGTATAIATALITKFTRIRDFPLFETALFLLMSYSTFLAAEAASLTGIVSLLFCGILQAHYTYYNLSVESRNLVRQVAELISFLAENFCFVQIGVTIFTFANHIWDIWFILASVLAVIVGRFCNVYPLSFLINCISACRHRKSIHNRPAVPIAFQHMMMFAGLRGAMAFALAIRDVSTPQRQVVFSTTLVIVVLTIIFCGALITPMLQILKIRVGVIPIENHGGHHDNSAMQPSSGGTSSGADGSPEDIRRRKASNDDVEPGGASETRVEEMTVIEQGSDNEMPDGLVDTVDDSEAITESQQQQARHTRYSSVVIRRWKSIDSRVLKPILTHSRPLLTDTFSKNSICQWIARVLTTDVQFESGSIESAALGVNNSEVGTHRFDPLPQGVASTASAGNTSPSPSHLTMLPASLAT